MNLLLLLTAFLASLTGMITGGRAVDTRVVSQLVEARVEQARAAAVMGARPVAALPGLAQIAQPAAIAPVSGPVAFDRIATFGRRRE